MSFTDNGIQHSISENDEKLFSRQSYFEQGIL
jgi:hypothetical protein